MDMNRNALWRCPEKVHANSVERMTAFWGDESWRDIAYGQEATLFGPEPAKLDNETIVEAFCSRLRQEAGFKYVAKPMPMRNSTGAVVYYLFFASQKEVALKIMKDIFAKA
jgi:three-Cys-motif partner protein